MTEWPRNPWKAQLKHQLQQRCSAVGLGQPTVSEAEHPNKESTTSRPIRLTS